MDVDGMDRTLTASCSGMEKDCWDGTSSGKLDGTSTSKWGGMLTDHGSGTLCCHCEGMAMDGMDLPNSCSSGNIGSGSGNSNSGGSGSMSTDIAVGSGD